MREPSNDLRKVTLNTLLKLRKNNYISVYYKNHTYDKNLVENEIKRKLEKNKKVWCYQCEIIHIQIECPSCREVEK